LSAFEDWNVANDADATELDWLPSDNYGMMKFDVLFGTVA